MPPEAGIEKNENSAPEANQSEQIVPKDIVNSFVSVREDLINSVDLEETKIKSFWSVLKFMFDSNSINATLGEFVRTIYKLK